MWETAHGDSLWLLIKLKFFPLVRSYKISTKLLFAYKASTISVFAHSQSKTCLPKMAIWPESKCLSALDWQDFQNQVLKRDHQDWLS